jgi:hypothetical protein
MTAPPQAHAQSFAKAMRTDMISHSSVAGVRSPQDRQQLRAVSAVKVQNKLLSATPLSIVYPFLARFSGANADG